MSAASTISNLQQALNCSGKCDCCENLQAQINDLRAQIAGIKPVDEQRIIKASVAEAQELIIPAVLILIGQKLAPIFGKIDALASLANAALNTANAALKSIAALVTKVGALATAVAGILIAIASLQILGSRIDAVEDGLSGLGADLSRVFGLLTGVKSIANTALNNAEAAQGAANAAQGTANNATNLAQRAIASATDAQATAKNAVNKADRAFQAAGEANNNAIEAAKRANTAQDTANDALSVAGTALNNASTAQQTANQASTLAQTANSTATNAIEKAGTALDTANGARTAANNATAAAGTAISRAGNAQRTADEALALARQPKVITNNNYIGIPGAQGIPGAPGARGERGAPGLQGAPGKNGINGKDGELSPEALSKITKIDGKLDKILPLVAATAAIKPLSFSQSVEAAAAGVCRSSQPGGCASNAIRRETNDLRNKLSDGFDKLNNAFSAGANAAQLALLNTMNNTLNLVNTKLGTQLASGLSGAMNSIVNNQVVQATVNYLSLATTIHNGLMLSNNLAQSLFSTVDVVLKVFGIQLKDENKNDVETGQLIGNSIKALLISILGEAQYKATAESWNKLNRIYQAASNLLNAFQSIGQSTLNALEVVGGWSAKVGNALRAAGEVSEKAYGWFNPQPNFQNRFFTGLEAAENIVSHINTVSSEVLNVKETVSQLGDLKNDLVKNLGEDEGSKKGIEAPEPKIIKQAAEDSKEASKGQDMNESDLEADEQ